jgi:PBSX family phage terminase large subunit
MTKKKKQITEADAKAQLWELGELSWKLKGKQIDIYNHFKYAKDDISACLVSRRFGKTTTLIVLCLEYLIQNKNSIIKYVCPTQKMVENSIKPIMREITEDCPYALQPVWVPSEKRYKFANGSELQVAGTDNGNYNSLRGGASGRCVVDEAGFCDDLETVVYSVLAPTTDTTGGKIWLASTPNPEELAHDFHEHFVHPMKAENKLVTFNIYDSPMLNEKQIEKIIARYPGGVENPKFKCEYLVEIPRATELSVIPEFYPNKENIIIKEYTMPAHYHAYVSMDVGFRDLTVALFAYYDFREATLYVIDEFVTNGPEMTTQFLAEGIKHKETMLYYNKDIDESITPYLRVMDNDLKLINDLARLHNLYFIPTAKDKKEVAINQVRMWAHNGRLKIHERCKHLIYHIESAQWTKNKDDFGRLKDSPSGDVRGGHADALDAYVYLIRNVSEFANPFPDGFGELKGPNTFKATWKADDASPVKDFMRSILNLRKKNKDT